MDWSAAENNGSVKFTSPQGVTILLEADKDNSSSSASGQDCTSLINTYNQTGDLCFDAAAFRYTGVFKKPADASTGWLILSVISREKPTIFYQMFDSLRPTP